MIRQKVQWTVANTRPCDLQENKSMMEKLFETSVETFDVDNSKAMIFNACKKNGIELFTRDAKSAIDALQIADVKEKMSKFDVASNDAALTLRPVNSHENILVNCEQVNRRIISMDASKELASVHTFALYYNMRQNIKAAKQLNKYKQVSLSALRAKLNDNTKKKMSNTQFSKQLRKYERVDQLVDVVKTEAGAFLLGVFITVYSLENDTQDDWTFLIQQLKDYLAFAMTLTLAADEMTPVVREE